ncbi:MAG: tripartite tricarboxylate transporter substrate binding protein [Clostridia bacterium]|nr:tripartite tricarboxylate transporter substrate binding protein [Clostridia bacterium]
MKRKWFLILLVAILSVTLVAGCGGSGNQSSQQQEPKEAEKPSYPEKPITYVIPFDAGGQSDIEARRQQPHLERILGQKILIEYKPGAGGAIGWTELTRSKPDGYTMTGINLPHIILQPAQRSDAGFKTEDIIPVAIFQATPIGLAVLNDSPFQTLEDFIAYAKENPGKITIAGSGTLSGHDIAHLQLEKFAGIELEYIPYTGAAPQLQAFLGGHNMAILANSNDLVAHKDKIRVLAFGATERYEVFPDAPTFIEKGFDMTPSIDRGVAVPPGTPEEIIKVLEDAFLQICNDPEIQKQMIEQGFVPKAMGHKESLEYIEKLTDQYLEILAAVQ